MRLYVGQAGFRGDISRYAQRFEMVEVLADRDKLPRRSRLESWRESVPPTFAWSVVLPPSVASLSSSADAEKTLSYAETTADALHAAWWVVKTPVAVTPTASSRRLLAALAARLQRSGRRVVWEPRGVWSETDVDDVARSTGLYVARDGAREELSGGPVVYSRIRALGVGARTGPAAIERLAARLRGREEAFVVFERQGAGRARDLLHEELATAQLQEQAE